MKAHQFSILILGLMYSVGLIGLHIPHHQALFEHLVPFHLLFVGIILFLFHSDRSANFLFFFIACLTLGYGVEVLGVKTGKIFGTYSYGETLGIKLLDVPLLIALNWFVLVYCTGHLLHRLKLNILLKSALGAMIMVLIDFLIEPTAVYFDFWHWESPNVPIKNYWGWFWVSYLLLFIYYYCPFKKTNRIAVGVFIFQVLFFAFHTGFIWYMK